MKYLFFTRSNGDIDNYPITDNKPAEEVEALTPASLRDEARRAFIGDMVEDFKVFDEADAPKNPIKNGTGYTANLLIDYEKKRDEIEAQAVISYQGYIILMDDRSRKGMNQAKDSLKRRSKSIPWKVLDVATGKKVRINISSDMIEKFEDAIVDEISRLHVQADTESPENRFPIEVV
jgi:hypothetical protein